MAVYDDLKALILEKPAKKAIKARYKTDANDRELWPHILGENSTSGYQVVLCYQGVGPDPAIPAKGYRCFRVDSNDLTLVGAPYIPTWNAPKKFNFKDVLNQGCVTIDEVDAYR